MEDKLVSEGWKRVEIERKRGATVGKRDAIFILPMEHVLGLEKATRVY